MKTKATMLIMGLFLLIGSYRASAQGMPVYDNTNFISLAKQLIESAKQTSQLLKTVQFLKQQKENIEKVNAVIKQLKAVRQLTQNHEKLYNRIHQDVRSLLNSPYIRPDEFDRISGSFDAMIDLSLKDLEFIDQILSSDLLRMTDTERATILLEKTKQSDLLLYQVDQQIQRYRDIISFRQMQEQLNTRSSGW